MTNVAVSIALAQFPSVYDLHVTDGEVHYMLAMRGDNDILDRLTGSRLLRDPEWRRQYEAADATVRQQMSRALTRGA